MSSVPPAADARQEAPAPDVSPEHLHQLGRMLEWNGPGDVARALHDAANEIERLQGELARLQAAVDSAGGLCQCGHTKDTHYEGHGTCWDHFEICPCETYAPRQAPAEGKGEGG